MRHSVIGLLAKWFLSKPKIVRERQSCPQSNLNPRRNCSSPHRNRSAARRDGSEARRNRSSPHLIRSGARRIRSEARRIRSRAHRIRSRAVRDGDYVRVFINGQVIITDWLLINPTGCLATKNSHGGGGSIRSKRLPSRSLESISFFSGRLEEVQLPLRRG